MKSKCPKTDSSRIMVQAVISWDRVLLLQPLYTPQIEDFCCHYYTFLHVHNICKLYRFLSKYSYNETCLNCCFSSLNCNSQYCAAIHHNVSVSLVHLLVASSQEHNIYLYVKSQQYKFFRRWNHFTANEAKNFNTTC
jgi:hypothetical protein